MEFHGAFVVFAGDAGPAACGDGAVFGADVEAGVDVFVDAAAFPLGVAGVFAGGAAGGDLAGAGHGGYLQWKLWP